MMPRSIHSVNIGLVIAPMVVRSLAIRLFLQAKTFKPFLHPTIAKPFTLTRSVEQTAVICQPHHDLEGI